MGQRLTKKQRTAKKVKNKAKKVRRMEVQDAKGISRKKFSFVIKPKTFFIMKIVGIVAIPVSYFVYSPILILVMIYFVVLFFVAIGCEHSLNKSVIKSNHIKIPKFDSAIALVLICIAIFGSSFTMSSGPVGMFANTMSMRISRAVKDMGSLLTGERSIFRSGPGGDHRMQFGTMDKPEGFIPDGEAFLNEFGGMPPQPGGRMPDFELSMDDIPIEFMFSQLLSTVTTVLIIAVGVSAAISLYYTIKKIKRFNLEQNEVIIDGAIILLEDQEIERILDFGEMVETI